MPISTDEKSFPTSGFFIHLVHGIAHFLVAGRLGMSTKRISPFLFGEELGLVIPSPWPLLKEVFTCKAINMNSKY